MNLTVLVDEIKNKEKEYEEKVQHTKSYLQEDKVLIYLCFNRISSSFYYSAIALIKYKDKSVSIEDTFHQLFIKHGCSEL